MLTQAEVQPFLDDYRVVTHRDTQFFICPITLEPCNLDEISNGHIINDAVPYAFNRTVPVRTSADNFYGTRVESSFVRFLTIADLSPMDMLRSQRTFDVRFSDGGQLYRAFIVDNDEVESKKNDLPVIGLSRDGIPFFVGLKGVDVETFEMPTDDGTFRPEISFSERFFPSHWVASMLKVAHLTMFDMVGYRAIFDPSADVLRRVIARYFYDKATRKDAPDYFRSFSNSVKVIGTGTHFSPDSYSPMDLDTLRDRKILCHFNGDRHFAATLVYKLPTKTISVTIPQTTDAVDIGVATRLYDRLMEDGSTLQQRVVLTRFDGKQWVGERDINFHYQPPFKQMLVNR